MPDIGTALTTALKEWKEEPVMIKGAVGTPTIKISEPPKGPNKAHPWTTKDPSGVSMEKRLVHVVMEHPGLTYREVGERMPKDKLSSITSLLAQHAQAGNMSRDIQGRYTLVRSPSQCVSLNIFKREKEKARKMQQPQKPAVVAATKTAAPAPTPSPQIQDVFNRWTAAELVCAMPVRYALALRSELANVFSEGSV